jgi:hypothetical protein
MYNNVSYDNGRSGALGAYGLQVYGADIDNAQIKNNIFMDNHLAAATSWSVHDNGTTITDSSGVVMDNNCHYDSTAHDNLIKWGSTNYATLSAFNTALTPQEDNGIEQDPTFVDAGNEDFHLLMNSPCVDAGVDVGLTQDHEGNTVPQ